jgi:hypothetical protein
MEFNITIRSAFPPYLVLRSKFGFEPAALSENKKEEIGERGEGKRKKRGKSKTCER